MPFLSKLVLSLSQRFLIFLCILLILFQSIFPTIYYLLGLDFKPYLPIAGYALYLFLGYLIANYDIEKKISIFWTVGFIAVLSLLFRFVYVFNSPLKDSFFFMYFGVYAVFPSVFIFMCAKKWCTTINNNKKKEKNETVWVWLSCKSFGIYLLHMFFLRVLSFRMSSQSPWYILFGFIGSLVFSFLVTTILQKNKYTKFLVP